MKNNMVHVLKPCPFCGGNVFMHTGYKNINFISCGQKYDGSDGCGAIVSFRHEDQKNYHKKWNRRTTV